jgi:hypothetical protein
LASTMNPSPLESATLWWRGLGIILLSKAFEGASCCYLSWAIFAVLYQVKHYMLRSGILT